MLLPGGCGDRLLPPLPLNLFPILLQIPTASTAMSLTVSPLLLHFPIAKENLFALSLFPYLGFLWFMSRSKLFPRLAAIGFYMTLVFVAITIPAGIYAQVTYGKQLADVDFLHGGAEFFLTLANILVVLGFQQAIDRQRRSSQL